MALPKIEFRDALISPDGLYRYWLARRWSGAQANSPFILWCMLNPSTADAAIDDPTIRRCIGFTDSWGYRSLIVVNLYAYRATNPRDLEGLSAEELQGPQNSFWLHSYTSIAKPARLVCAWGANRFKCLPVSPWITGTAAYCLAYTKDGEPKHPLYLPADSALLRMN